MLEQQSFAQEEVPLFKMTATKQKQPFYFVSKLPFSKNRRVSILLMQMDEIRWTLANLRGTFDYYILGKFCSARGPSICQPRCYSQAFHPHAVFFQNLTTDFMHAFLHCLSSQNLSQNYMAKSGAIDVNQSFLVKLKLNQVSVAIF